LSDRARYNQAVVRLASLLLCALSLLAQSEFYAFAVDQDALGGAPDFSFLNHPLTAADAVFVRDGHFFRVGPDLVAYTPDDERVRFYGVNLAFGANFPDPPDAQRIARRLRRLGVNLVRLHHMDSQPDASPSNAGSLLTTGPYPTLNPVAVSRLRGFLDALKAEGIYANLNLHVGYTFRPAVDGVPAIPGVDFPTQSKPLQVFYPRMVSLQTEYARRVIEALRLNGDPVLAMVEIDNESSLLYAWQTSQFESAVVGAYATELRAQWNAFLRPRFASTDALRAAWGATEPDGPEMLTATGWRTEIHAPARATMAAGDPVVVTIQQGGSPCIVKQVGFSVAAGESYTGEIEMRADIPAGQSRNVYWDVKQDVSPWNTATSRTIAVTSEWTKFRLAFQAPFAMNAVGRFAVSVENIETRAYLRNWSFRRAGRRGLSDGESLEAGSVSLVLPSDIGTEARTNDFLIFVADRDRAYLDQVAATVRDAAGAPVAVTGTQMGYGGLMNLDSHAGLDYLDEHFYVDHYSFPHTAWDGFDWTVQDTASSAGGFSAFLRVAAGRQWGKPYTVSEYNQPWPNTHAAEINPALAAFGAFQDWDGLMHFAYSHGRNWDAGVPNGFNINGDWTKWPILGQAAWLFRSGAIRAGIDPQGFPVDLDARLRFTRQKRNGDIGGFVGAATTPFLHPVYLLKDLVYPPPVPVSLPAYNADTGEITYDAKRGLYLIHSPQAAGVIGAAGSGKVTAGAIDVELAASARGFAVVLATALDGRALADSSRVLLSTPGYSLRTQPGTRPARVQQLVNYTGATNRWTLEQDPARPDKPSGNLNDGVGPTWMERVESFVTLRTTAARLTVYPLDGSGARLAPLAAADVAPVDGGFRLHLQAAGETWSPWYEIVAGR
jgi:hypothetical protein